MNKPSILLSLFAWLLILLSPVLLFIEIAADGNKIPGSFKDGIAANAKIEAKKDSAVKNEEGKTVSFIYVSYHITYSTPKKDTLNKDSVSAMNRMLRAENFKVDIPGLKFSKLVVEKNKYDLLKEGDSLKIIYSGVDPDLVMLPQDNPEKKGAGKTETKPNNNSAWIGGCIVAFMFGIWILVMNKRRRAQGQESDPLSSMNVYSSIKKEEPPKTGGRPE